jgi:hypothetical protein
MYIGKTYKEVQRIGGVIVKLYSGTVSATGDSKAAYKWIPPFISRANLFVKATENSGTATMDVKVVTMHPRVPGHITDWYDLQAFTQLSATGKEKKSLANGLGDKLAVVWTVGGTGNWTIEVYAELKL